MIPDTMLEARLRLSNIPRWTAVKMSRTQYVSEHIVGVCYMLKCLPLDDYYKTIVFALEHEDDEAAAGHDIPSNVKEHEKKADHGLTDNDYGWFKFCDYAEAWLYATEYCTERWDKKLEVLSYLALKMAGAAPNDNVFGWLATVSVVPVPKVHVEYEVIGGVVPLLDTGGRHSGRVTMMLYRCLKCGGAGVARKADIIAGRYKSCGCEHPHKTSRDKEFIIRTLLDRVTKNPMSRCWEWTGSKFKKGYGRFHYMGEVQAHRVSYRLFNGDIPNGLFVCHTCDNPMCVNPDHLFLGTNSDNIQDCMKKGRHKSPRGENHPACKLTDKEVKAIRKSDESVYALSERYDVAPQTISKIRLVQSRKMPTPMEA